MEFFAYNLCLQLTDAASSPSYDYPLTDWQSLLGLFESDNLFDGQTIYLKAEKNFSWIKDFFEFQTIEKNRQKNAKVVVRFEDRAELEEFRDNFLKLFKHEAAAGGLVQNEKQEFLFIQVQNHWTLPKGHVEKNESIETAAIREVCEETALQNPTIVHPLSTTYHTFLKKDKWRWKITYWFKMIADSNESLTPQLDENIQAVHWFDKDTWMQYKDKTFNQHKLMLREAYCQLP